MDPVWKLIERAQAGDTEASGQLIEENQGLVWSIVRRYMGRGQDPEDLFQIGAMGLLKAIQRFDFRYETRLSTYAVPVIAGEIRRFLRDDGLIKVSRTIQGQAMLLRRASEELSYRLGRDPSMAELAAETGLSMEDIIMADGSTAAVESLEQPVAGKDGQEISIKEQLVDTKQMDEKDRLLNQILLHDLLAQLGYEEREFIEMRYMNEKTQTAIARLLGISQVQVCRMEKRILKKMREMAAG